MRRQIYILAVLLWLGMGAALRADGLPTFDDFRRIDRTRRLTGQMQTAELLEVSQIKRELLLNTVQANSNDARIVWGAAELMGNWNDRRPLFESAQKLMNNDVAVTLRFACAAARQGEYDLGMKGAKYCQANDHDNTLPWLLELWILGKQKKPQVFEKDPPEWATSFRDYSVEGSEMRIRTLEKAGYSPYSARRLGFKPDSDALWIIRDLARPPMEEATKMLLKETAGYLQQRKQFLLTELVGETIERTLLALREDRDRSVEVRMRGEEIEQRREELKQLLSDVERNTVDYATERQMTEYFNDVLALGEEDAMKRLAQIVQRPGTNNVPAAVTKP